VGSGAGYFEQAIFVSLVPDGKETADDDARIEKVREMLAFSRGGGVFEGEDLELCVPGSRKKTRCFAGCIQILLVARNVEKPHQRASGVSRNFGGYSAIGASKSIVVSREAARGAANARVE
jgi:hypothetical protein